MKVVISGYYGFDNIGDEAILKSIIMALREEDKDIEITVLSNNPKSTMKNYNVNAISRWNLKKIFNELRCSDGLISGGGSLLQDVTSSRSILYYTSIMGLANLLKKPVCVYAQGIGPINKKFNKKIVKYFLNKVQYISLRDIESKEFINSIGVNKEVEIVPDPVMGLEFKYPDINKKDSYIIISIRDWINKEKYLNELCKFCENIKKEGINIKLLPMHGKLDEEISKRLANMLSFDVEIISYKLNIESKLRYIKYAKLMVGMRLHALIFAGNVGTPMMGISYDPKIDSYLKLVNQPCVGNIKDGIDYNILTKTAMDIIKNYDNVKIKLDENIYNLKSTARLTASKTINVFKLNKNL